MRDLNIQEVIMISGGCNGSSSDYQYTYQSIVEYSGAGFFTGFLITAGYLPAGIFLGALTGTFATSMMIAQYLDGPAPNSVSTVAG